ncbi:MAG TPA: hypothetical protein VKY73_09070 [Polyangiaceae bacterium]|nr:hypothetical protein [Polyangiaceae bacterium]
MDPLFIILFSLAIPLLLCGVFWLVSHVLAWAAGWPWLAAHYAAEGPVVGLAFSHRSGGIGLVRFKWCLEFTVNASGLGVAVKSPFSFGHRPLFVPWSDISARPQRSLFVRSVEIRFAKARFVRLHLRRRLAEELLAHAGCLPPLDDAT